MSSDLESEGTPPLAQQQEFAPGYTVVAHLRRGEDLDIYDLWSHERGCRCIGKSVRPDRLEHGGARARLLREGRLLLRLTHPHIVRAYDIRTDPQPIVILETLPGETLAHLIERRPRGLPARDVAQLGLHLCSAIGYLHRQGVLHLDIKPANIIASQGLAKVLDLSLARAPGRYRGGAGTPGYMAPEQVEGGDHGAQTDVWAIGATLFEAATGDPACDLAERCSSSQSDAALEVCLPGPIRSTRRIVTPLADIIDRSLRREPMERPTIGEFSAAMDAVLALR